MGWLGSPSEERRAGDEEGEEPHAEADVDGEALGPPAPGVRDGPRDGEVAVDRDGAQTNVGRVGWVMMMDVILISTLRCAKYGVFEQRICKVVQLF